MQRSVVSWNWFIIALSDMYNLNCTYSHMHNVQGIYFDGAKPAPTPVFLEQWVKIPIFERK